MKKTEFDKKMKALEKSMRTLPTKIGAVAVRFSKDRFRQRNWIDRTQENWPKRKRSNGRKRDNRAVLVDSGRLKKSVRKTFASQEKIIIGTDVPYAQVHNEGFKGTVKVKAHTRRRTSGRSRDRSQDSEYEVKAHSRKVDIPKRQFIGESKVLTEQIEKTIQEHILKALT